MIKPISWLDIFFFAAFLIPNLIFQISAKELFLLLFVGVPYGTIPRAFVDVLMEFSPVYPSSSTCV
jgi:hypothetical protein